MIRDRLLRQITEAISQPLDPEAFERAAEALLETRYPTLVPVSGGADIGQDGVTSEPDSIILVSTVGEGLVQNLRTNLKSHIKDGGSSRRALFATSRPLNAHARVALNDAANKLGFELVQSYGQDWFVNALHDQPKWRQELLNIAGDAPALSSIPKTTWPESGVALIGRDADLDALRMVKGDGLIVGLPGIGKSAVLGQLAEEGWGVFLTRQAIAASPDDIRELKPLRIVIDDAQFALEELTGLRQLREDMDETFDIVAVTWPGSHETEVQERLHGSWRRELRELTRPQIVEVLRSSGLQKAGDRLIWLLVNQARGRPGLAVLLAQLAVAGNLKDVASGDALLRRTTVISKGLTGAAAGNVLGVISLAGDAGIDLPTLSSILGISLDAAQQMAEGLASGGIISETRPGSKQLIVLPEDLRYPAVKQVFFSAGTSLDAATILAKLSYPEAAVVPLVAAKHRGAAVPEKLFDMTLVAATNLAAWEAYAGLGETQARRAIDARPAYAEKLALAALTSSPTFAIHTLLDSAQASASKQTLEQSVREIERWINEIDEDVLERRCLVADAVNGWVATEGSSDVALEVLVMLVDPGIETSRPDPGSPHTIQMRRSVFLVPGLKRLSPIWNDIVSLFTEHECANYNALLKGLGDWCYPGRLSGTAVDAATREFARERVTGVMASLAKVTTHAGLRTMMSRLAKAVGLKVSIDEDKEYAVLYPESRYRGRRPEGYALARKRSATAAAQFGTTLASLAPTVAVDILNRTTKAAIAVHETDISFAVLAATALAEICSEPDVYVEAGLAGELETNLLAPFLRHAARRTNGSSTVLSTIGDERYWVLGAIVASIEDVSEETFDAALERFDVNLASSLASFVARREISDSKLERLLAHADRAAAMQVAVALSFSSFGLPPAVAAAWERAIVDSPLDSHHSIVFGSRPDLLQRWLDGWMARRRANGPYEYLNGDMTAEVSKLPGKARRRLLEEVLAEEQAGFDDLVSSLVAQDFELVKWLFPDNQRRPYQSLVLRGDPLLKDWLPAATLALRSGWRPADIVRQTALGYFGTSELNHYQELLSSFEKLSKETPEGVQLGAIGIECFAALLDEAAERDRREEVLGF